MYVKYNKSKDFKRNVRFDDVEMTFCLDVKFPGKESWITVKYERALRDRRTGVVEAEEHDELLSTAGEIPVVGVREEEGPGKEAAGGCVLRTTWRAPTGK